MATTKYRVLTTMALAAFGAFLAQACGGADGSATGGGPSPDRGCEVAGAECATLCDPNLGCVDCLVDDDCGRAEPACVHGECRECGTATDCPTGQACFPRDHECAPACETDADCNGDAPFCDEATGACLGCRDDDDCGAEDPLCDPVTAQCGECLRNEDCGVARPLCDLEDRSCEECLVDTDCELDELCRDHRCGLAPVTQCDPGLVACGDAGCVDVSEDPDHCGGCGERCEAGSACISGICSCGPGLERCNDRCVDVDSDPRHCGRCGAPCGDAEFCDAGACVCRPGLTLVDGNCIDTASRPERCGADQATCDGATPRCQQGDCVADCSAGFESCGDACVDFDSDPLNCGDCGERCSASEVCSNGECRDWVPAGSCNSCPCDSCGGDFDTCCTYPGEAGLRICVDGECP